MVSRFPHTVKGGVVGGGKEQVSEIRNKGGVYIFLLIKGGDEGKSIRSRTRREKLR